MICEEKELSTQKSTITGDVLVVVRTGTEAVCGVFVVLVCNDVMVIVGLPKYLIMASGIVAVLMIIA